MRLLLSKVKIGSGLKQRFFLLLFLCCLFSVTKVFSQTTYTWTGSSGSDWGTATNWSPNGIPGSADSVLINSTSVSPSLSGNVSIAQLTINSATLTLNGNSLSTSTSATFSGSVVTAGTLNLNGSLADFGNTVFNASIVSTTSDVFFYGSVFNQPVNSTKTGSSDNYSDGGDTFNADINFTVSGIGYFALEYNFDDTFNGNIIVSSTNPNGIIIFGTRGGKAYMASGELISIGSQGFQGSLQLQNFIQQGSDLLQLNLTSGTSSLYLDAGTILMVW